MVSEPVTPQREERAADVVHTFEQRRDTAQLQAALERWQQGDPAGCEARLTAIVQRHPDYLEARLRLAEVLSSRSDFPAAESHLRTALEHEPDSAEAHHSLGLLLSSSDQTDDALHHLTLAADLEPQNEIYRLTLQSIQ